MFTGNSNCKTVYDNCQISEKNLDFFLLYSIMCLWVFPKKQQAKNTAAISTIKTTWKKGARLSLFVGQAGSKNWASGSDVFSVSANAFLNAYANGAKGKWFFNNSIIASYGLINTDEYSTIKNDDKIDFFSTAGANFKKKPKSGISCRI